LVLTSYGRLKWSAGQMKSPVRLAVLLVLVVTAHAPGAPPTTRAKDSRTGEFQIVFTERNALSDPAVVATRHGWVVSKLKAEGAETQYELSKESFEVRVPRDYEAAKKFGLLVWISAGQSGKANGAWNPVLDAHHLIWVGANRAGNSRSVMVRLGLALDAVSNMKSRYSIDADRVYISGGSGGGRCASMLGVSCADVFHGGIYMIGCDYFRDIPTGEANRFWPRSYVQPSARLVGFARQRSRHVLLTGEQDMNRAQTKANFESGFRRDGFEHVNYLEVPGMGHRLPPGEWFEKAVGLLDSPGPSVGK
jgi:hypothetical protein